MQKPPAAIFIGASGGLDFLNSVATPVDVEVDWIADGEGLLNWLEQAHFVPAAVLASMRAQALPGELDKIADQARNLREWFRGFVHAHHGRKLTASDLIELEPLNRLLERDEGFSRVALNPGGASIVLERTRRWRSPESLLLPIADELARLICNEDFSYVKPCEGHLCTLLFADHTRGRARRWCTMAICGNRAKQASHRKRTKALEHDG
jgi:predicted RNA-binding Zn ribbon-like protein